MGGNGSRRTVELQSTCSFIARWQLKFTFWGWGWGLWLDLPLNELHIFFCSSVQTGAPGGKTQADTGRQIKLQADRVSSLCCKAPVLTTEPSSCPQKIYEGFDSITPQKFGKSWLTEIFTSALQETQRLKVFFSQAKTRWKQFFFFCLFVFVLTSSENQKDLKYLKPHFKTKNNSDTRGGDCSFPQEAGCLASLTEDVQLGLDWKLNTHRKLLLLLLSDLKAEIISSWRVDLIWKLVTESSCHLSALSRSSSVFSTTAGRTVITTEGRILLFWVKKTGSSFTCDLITHKQGHFHIFVLTALTNCLPPTWGMSFVTAHCYVDVVETQPTLTSGGSLVMNGWASTSRGVIRSSASILSVACRSSTHCSRSLASPSSVKSSSRSWADNQS